MRRFTARALAALAIVAVPIAAHAGELDGTWTGYGGQWNIALKVSGSVADLTLQCAGFAPVSFANVPVQPDGSLNFLTPPEGRFTSRRVHGQLPHVVVDPVGFCGTGDAVLKRN